MLRFYSKKQASGTVNPINELIWKITRLSCGRSQIFLSFLKIGQACFAMDAMGTGGYPCDDEGSEDAFEGAAVTLQVCLASGQSASRLHEVMGI